MVDWARGQRFQQAQGYHWTHTGFALELLWIFAKNSPKDKL